MQNRLNAIQGALVADAASMGLHWMYDHHQIDKIAETGDLLFRQPDRNVYAERKAYFAHADKRSGDFSQYGEAAKVVFDAASGNSGYSVKTHQEIFFETFGPCGSYHGFADRPTNALIAKIIIDCEKYGEKLSKNFPARSGSDDDQLPALCCVPSLFFYDCAEDTVDSAVGVTTTNNIALHGARVLHKCLNAIALGIPLKQALSDSLAGIDSELKIVLQDALDVENYDARSVVNRFGLACHMTQGLPVAWHLLNHATDYESVVRENIRCGGDCCGRAMAVGSVAGLVFGVPARMKQRVRQLNGLI